MECEVRKSAPDTAEWKSGDHDCLWVLFQGVPREPLSTRLLQWVDWKLKGTLSKYLQDAKAAKTTTFIPTVNRIPANFIALESQTVDWDAFVRNCEGMKLKRVLMVSPDGELLKTAERELKNRKKVSFPETVHLSQDLKI